MFCIFIINLLCAPIINRSAKFTKHALLIGRHYCRIFYYLHSRMKIYSFLNMLETFTSPHTQKHPKLKTNIITAATFDAADKQEFSYFSAMLPEHHAHIIMY